MNDLLEMGMMNRIAHLSECGNASIDRLIAQVRTNVARFVNQLHRKPWKRARVGLNDAGCKHRHDAWMRELREQAHFITEPSERARGRKREVQHLERNGASGIVLCRAKHCAIRATCDACFDAKSIDDITD